MSNLLKQNYIVQNPQNVRVINSNQRLEERINQLNQTNSFSNDNIEQQETFANNNDSFQSGIVTDQIVVEPAYPSVEEIVSDAKQEAERILETANLEAKQIVEKAQEHALTMKEEAKNTGYNEGMQQAQKDLDLAREKHELDWKEKEIQLEKDYQKKLELLESDLIDVIIRVFDKVFHIQFENKRDILFYLVHNAILNNENNKKFRIKVSRDNKEYLDEHMEQLLNGISKDVSIEVMEELKFGPTECIIETDTAVFDCGIDTEFETLVKDIRSLC